MKRLHNLDYLRGLAAFGILLYHYLSWTIGRFDSESTIGRIGLYGVSIFYILSGLTLFIVYYEKMNFSKNEIIGFIKKRVFRIFPLMWLVVIISILFSQKVPNVYDLIMNLTGLFGFINWDKYFAIGLWSIGNELVFYSFFILFLFSLKRSKLAFYIISFIVLFVFLYFAFFMFEDKSESLYSSNNWKTYINPLNQLFLFLSGFLLGYLLNKRKMNNKISLLLLFFGLFLFIFYPEYGDRINIISGNTRIVLTIASILICVGFFKSNFNLPSFVHKPLVLLGEISYSLYLVHPLIFYRIRFVADYISNHYFKINIGVTLLVSIILSLIISYFVYNYFEKYFIKLGNNKTSKI